MRQIVSAVAVTASIAAFGLGETACRNTANAESAQVPAFIRHGERIVVPAGSPLRTRLVLGAPAMDRIAPELVLPGVVEADPARQDKVLPPLSGRIVKLGARLGDRVRAGQVLAIVASPDFAQAVADDAKARSQLTLTERARDRALAVLKIGGAAEKDAQQALSDYAAAEAEAARTSARLRQIGGQGANLTIRAPMAGVVTDLSVSPGSFWNDTTAPLMTVTDTSTVWVTANVPEQNLADVRKGQDAQIAFVAYPGEVFTGRVLFVGDVLDPDTRRAKARIALSNKDGRLKPGMFATITFRAHVQNAVTAPTSALILKDDAMQVFAEVAPWVFEPRKVQTGIDQGERTAILSGLQPGQRIVVKGAVLLND
jgi:cobalt-zinc-cadmium efflux system membrane fusion protein